MICRPTMRPRSIAIIHSAKGVHRVVRAAGPERRTGERAAGAHPGAAGGGPGQDQSQTRTGQERDPIAVVIALRHRVGYCWGTQRCALLIITTANLCTLLKVDLGGVRRGTRAPRGVPVQSRLVGRGKRVFGIVLMAWEPHAI